MALLAAWFALALVSWAAIYTVLAADIIQAIAYQFLCAAIAAMELYSSLMALTSMRAAMELI
jgi:hypothetical protein